jgi:hypothetical protein
MAMDHLRHPTWVAGQIGAASIGGAGLIALAVWVGSDPSKASLGYVQLLFWFMGLLAVFALIGIVAHWKWHSLPPISMFLVAVSYFLHWPLIMTGSLLAVSLIGYLIFPTISRSESATNAVRPVPLSHAALATQAVMDEAGREAEMARMRDRGNGLQRRLDEAQNQINDLQKQLKAVTHERNSFIRERNEARVELESARQAAQQGSARDVPRRHGNLQRMAIALGTRF